MNTDTPETDAVAKEACDDTGCLVRPEIVWDSHANLERQLAAVTAQRDRLAAAAARAAEIADYWWQDATCLCLSTLPIGGCMACDMATIADEAEKALDFVKGTKP